MSGFNSPVQYIPPAQKLGPGATGETLTLAGPLSLPDGSATTPALGFSADSNTGLYRAAGDNLRLVTGGTDRLTIDSSGRVGIGTNGPGRHLVLSGSSALFEIIKSNASSNQGRWTYDAGSTDGVLYLQAMNDAENAGASWLEAYRSGTTISSVRFPGGNVGIGGAPSSEANYSFLTINNSTGGVLEFATGGSPNNRIRAWGGTLGAGAAASFGQYRGMLMVTNASDDTYMICGCSAAGAFAQIGTNNAAAFQLNSDPGAGSGKIGIYISGSTFYIHNRYGGSKVIRCMLLGI
ncbi:MAG: hypothetical protein U0556_09850 [Dehalococcoidia bacterium]